LRSAPDVDVEEVVSLGLVTHSAPFGGLEWLTEVVDFPTTLPSFISKMFVQYRTLPSAYSAMLSPTTRSPAARTSRRVGFALPPGKFRRTS
jgi:hypothetical protein